jgi:hypothetical protein
LSALQIGRMTRKHWTMMLVLPALFVAGRAAAVGVEHSHDPATGLETWQWHGEGASFSFKQLLPDQSRAYFQGRGFQGGDAERVAFACVFQAIIRNPADAAAPLETDLSEWRVIPAPGNPRPPRLESDWQGEWERRGIARPARIAFRWSLFPTRQTFQPGDWNMGMVTFGPPPGDPFDLELAWRQGTEPGRLRLEEMRCAPDRH